MTLSSKTTPKDLQLVIINFESMDILFTVPVMYPRNIFGQTSNLCRRVS